MSGGAAAGGGKTGGAGINVQALGMGASVPGKQPVSSLDFHREGEFLVSGAEDGEQGWHASGVCVCFGSVDWVRVVCGGT